MWVPIIRTIVFWGLYWGPLYFGKLPFHTQLFCAWQASQCMAFSTACNYTIEHSYIKRFQQIPTNRQVSTGHIIGASVSTCVGPKTFAIPSFRGTPVISSRFPSGVPFDGPGCLNISSWCSYQPFLTWAVDQQTFPKHGPTAHTS